MLDITYWMIVLPPILFVVFYVLLNYSVSGEHSVCVVVLGDVGRSPRMQYHSVSLASENFHVDVVGYGGSIPHSGFLTQERITHHKLWEPPSMLTYFPRLVAYALKVVWQCITLTVVLLSLPKSAIYLVQNPPAIPSLSVIWLVCIIRNSSFIIDWHNYAYTILSLSLKSGHPLVIVSKWYERLYGWLSKKNICVTEAMKNDLYKKWSIRASVLYDRPPEMFKPADVSNKHKLFTKLAATYSVFKSSSGNADETAFTSMDSSETSPLKDDTPALLVSSTSWTEDEDFSILLAALDDYEETVKAGGSGLPDVVCVITGKGPLKEYYREIISCKQWCHVKVCLPWLEAEDYPVLLGSADLGICLHKSSSGLDLPMKVVDMFGCGLPVCALNFNCLDELVKHGENGLVFDNSDELAAQLKSLLAQYPKKQMELENFRQNLRTFRDERWHDNWKKSVLPLFLSSESMKKDR